jgi:1-deoxy-D-xylulose-5-phosphate reductoisomerase
MKQGQGIAILGSTGSIGTQALEVIDAHKEAFFVSVLSAGNNAKLLIEQALKWKPDSIVIHNEALYPRVQEALKNEPIKVFTGTEAIEQVLASEEIEVVINALSGFAGLKPSVAALQNRKKLALANKESLVVAGKILRDLCNTYKTPIIPVDSEHSALLQCLNGEYQDQIKKIIITASGGPFFGKSREELKTVTSLSALKHPNWVMGDKITIDSATLINKGFEVMEAQWLFDLRSDQIEVLIHPQSIIHSMIEFIDNSVKAQLSLPDMKIPIQYALSYPERIPLKRPGIDFLKYNTLTFEKPDTETFPNLLLAYHAMDKGGSVPCVLNASNEIAVRAFLDNRIGFHDIYRINEYCVAKMDFIPDPDIGDFVHLDKKTRILAENII